MDTGDALLQAIVDEPDDDSLRLIYADWLQDHDQPERAEFIRVEIAMHARWPDTDGSTPAEYDDPEYHRLAVLRKELLARHRKEWFGALVPLVGSFQTARGFVWQIDTTARKFAERADEILAAAPLAGNLWLDRLGGHLPRVAGRPELTRMRSLNFFESPLGSAGVQALCGSAYLGNLRAFHAMDCQIGPAGAEALSRTALLAGLQELDLWDNPIYDAGAAALLTSCHLSGLRHLRLFNCGVTGTAIEALARHTGSLGLVALSLDNNLLTQPALELLATAPQLATVERLSLSQNSLGAGVRALADSPHLHALRGLSLRFVEATDAALAALLRSDNVGPVQALDLDGNPCRHDTLTALAEARLLRNMRSLGLSNCTLGENALEYLARAELPALEKLDLHQNPVQAAGIRHLVGSASLARLRVLNLANCQIANGGAEALASAAALASVRCLGLASNGIGNAGAIALARSPHLNHLARLDLSGNRIGAKPRRALDERFGAGVCQF